MSLEDRIMSPLFVLCLPSHPKKDTRQVLILENLCVNLTVKIRITIPASYTILYFHKYDFKAFLKEKKCPVS